MTSHQEPAPALYGSPCTWPCTWPCLHHKHHHNSGSSPESAQGEILKGAENNCWWCKIALSAIQYVSKRAFFYRIKDCRETHQCKGPSFRDGMLRMLMDCDQPQVGVLTTSIRKSPVTDRENFYWRRHTNQCNYRNYRPVIPSGARSGAEVAANRRSFEVMSKYRLWLYKCLSDHDTCNAVGKVVMPSRLLDLDLGLETSSKSIRLITKKQRLLPYIALSYFWGTVKPSRTTNLNPRYHTIRMNLRRLPECYKEAIATVRELEYQYLWIDAFCINAEDCDREVAHIGEIFPTPLSF